MSNRAKQSDQSSQTDQPSPPGVFNRMLDRWADQNVQGRGKNALRFLGFLIAAGACVAMGVKISISSGIMNTFGMRIAGLMALGVLFLAIGLVGLAAICLLMSLMNAIRTGKLG